MTQSSIPIPSIVITLVVLVFVLYRQLTTRPLRERSWIPVVLVVIGAVDTVQVVSRSVPSLRDTGILLLSIVIGIALAALRALTVKIWADGDQVLRRGNVLTALLWLVSLAQHVVFGGLASPALVSATLLIYFGLVLAAQQYLLLIRALSRGLFARPS